MEGQTFPGDDSYNPAPRPDKTPDKNNVIPFQPAHDTQSERAEVRSEEAIHASELSYRRLFETARDGILILDVDTGRITDVNPFLVELLGFSREEMIGKTVGELSPFNDIESNKVMLGRLQTDGYVRYDDLPLETRDGRLTAVEFVSAVYQAGSKKVIQCNIRDITQRKQTEMISGQLAAIVESSDEAIIGKDLNGIVHSWNSGAAKIFGYSSGEIIGSSIRRLIPSELQEEEDRVLDRIKRGDGVQRFETIRLKKDGQRINVFVITSPIKDLRGKVTGISKLAHDITDRKRTEARIHLLNTELENRVLERTRQLETANQELEAFSYSVSHDLRAPLRHVSGFVALLKRKAEATLSPENLLLLEDISGAAARMGTLIDDLLTFSRIGKSEMQKTDVNLDELVRETLDDFRTDIKDRNLIWNIDPLPSVCADRPLLRMALVNLISNAVKFTGHCAAAKIEIKCIASGGTETVLSISDNGAGFDPQYASKLFGVFQRLHDRDEFEGTGIGLANVQRIIHRHGGRVWAEGAVGRGATFYFSIPTENGGACGN